VSQHGWTCAECGKVCYLTRRAALRAARRLPRRPGSKYRAYQCGAYWHLTSQPTAVLTGWREWDSQMPP
jgi:hypothetical protein